MLDLPANKVDMGLFDSQKRDVLCILISANNDVRVLLSPKPHLLHYLMMWKCSFKSIRFLVIRILDILEYELKEE